MNILIILLRLIHIVSGAFWVGSAIFTDLFLSPAVAANGDAGQKLMGYMVTKGRLSVRVRAAAILTVLAGGVLYWIDSGGLTSAWTTSAAGWGFGIGALFALAGLGFGLIVGKNASKLGMIAVAAQGKPSQEQLTEMQDAQKQMGMASRISTAAILIALICMATARYWGM